MTAAEVNLLAEISVLKAAAEMAPGYQELGQFGFDLLPGTTLLRAPGQGPTEHIQQVLLISDNTMNIQDTSRNELVLHLGKP